MRHDDVCNKPISKLYDADDWTWVMARRQRKKRKVLAGFARATGDRALTASIHDVVVLPELQGLGLGRKLLAKATNQVIGFLCKCTLSALSVLYHCSVQSGVKMLSSMYMQQKKPDAIHQCNHPCTRTPGRLKHVWCF